MSIPACPNVYARRHLCCVHVSALLTALAPVTQHQISSAEPHTHAKSVHFQGFRQVHVPYQLVKLDNNPVFLFSFLCMFVCVYMPVHFSRCACGARMWMCFDQCASADWKRALSRQEHYQSMQRQYLLHSKQRRCWQRYCQAPVLIISLMNRRR